MSLKVGDIVIRNLEGGRFGVDIKKLNSLKNEKGAVVRIEGLATGFFRYAVKWETGAEYSYTDSAVLVIISEPNDLLKAIL